MPISRSSRVSSALTLAWVPTGMNTGVWITPRLVVNRPSRAFDPESVFNNSNMRKLNPIQQRSTKQKQNLPEPAIPHAEPAPQAARCRYKNHTFNRNLP